MEFKGTSVHPYYSQSRTYPKSGADSKGLWRALTFNGMAGNFAVSAQNSK